MEKNKKFEIPHVYIILMIVMLIVVILSIVVPSGEYVREIDEATGRTIVDSTSYHVIEKPPIVGPLKFFGAIYEGSVKAAGIIMSLLLIAGTLELLEYTGTVEAGIRKLITLLKGKEGILPPILLIVFAILGATGWQEGALPFYPIALAIVLAIGYDRIAGVAVAALGIAAGFTSGTLNLFTTGIAQEIIGLPLYSGVGFRAIGTVLFASMAATYVYFYCKKIKKDPSKSFVAEEYIEQLNSRTEESDAGKTADWRQISSLVGLFFVVMLQGYGTIKLGWGLPQISAIYIMLALYIIIVFRIGGNNACEIYANGSKKMLPAALVLGIANGVMVLMEHGKIIDTAINGLVNTFQGKSPVMIVFILYIAIIGFNVLVTTGSGKAMILMPILAPFAQIININAQLMVLIFQYADGFTNYFWPTSGVLMVGLAMCKVDWRNWAKFAWKIILLMQIVAFVLVVIALKINLGPF